MNARALAKWTERLLGLIIGSAYVAFIVAEGLDGLYEHADPMIYPFFSMMVLSLIGYVASWYWEDLGGVLMIFGGSFMLAFHLLRHDFITALVYGVPFIVVGLLALTSVSGNWGRPGRTNKIR